MIIKSMSRKSTSFSQLYDYLTRDENSHTFSRNTYTQAHSRNEFINEFYENAKHIKNSRGKVFMYHEVLSLEINNLSISKQKEILLDLSEKYLSSRADRHLSFGVVHEEKNNIHLHLMISANGIEGEQRIRLSKEQFSQIQKDLENYKNQNYPELEQSSFYQNEKDLSKEKQQEQELKNRGARSVRDEIKEELERTFSNATSKTYLEKHLHSLGYEIYTRGQTQGIKCNGKKYRLKTLGLELEYKQLLTKLERTQQREMKREHAKEQKIKDPRFYRDVGRKKVYDERELSLDDELEL